MLHKILVSHESPISILNESKAYNDYDYALPRLTLKQESIIQHCLIYWHNLNLKTWGLTHFPNNARLLHQLLEPNIHTVTACRGINHLDGPDGLGLV